MSDREFENALEQALRFDLPETADKLRHALLAYCLSELDTEAHSADLEDDQLGMLAAAGDTAPVDALRPPVNGASTLA